MKISLGCNACIQDRLKAGLSTMPKDVQTELPLQNSIIYEFDCPNGHHNIIALRNPKFELLFESGILALKDGYYREAVTSFSASLERFYEFLTTAFLLPEIEKSPSGFQQAWKFFLNSSERQLGGVFLLHYKIFNEPLLAFDIGFIKKHNLSLSGKEPVNFRNAVIHQGFIPSFKDVINYGDAIYKYIGEVLVGLSSMREWQLRLYDTVLFSEKSTYDVDGEMTIPIQVFVYFLNAIAFIASASDNAEEKHFISADFDKKSLRDLFSK